MTNNRGYIYVLFIILVTAFSPKSNAEWFLSIDPPNDNQNISDDFLEFKLGSLSCGVTKTEFFRTDSNYLHESRKLYCQTTEGILFAVQANCRNFDHVSTQLLVEKGNTRFFPTLICDQHKAGHLNW
jgi:hypothetical protein